MPSQIRARRRHSLGPNDGYEAAREGVKIQQHVFVRAGRRKEVMRKLGKLEALHNEFVEKGRVGCLCAKATTRTWPVASTNIYPSVSSSPPGSPEYNGRILYDEHVGKHCLRYCQTSIVSMMDTLRKRSPSMSVCNAVLESVHYAVTNLTCPSLPSDPHDDTYTKDYMKTHGSLCLIYEYVRESLHTSIGGCTSGQICSVISSLLSGIIFMEQKGRVPYTSVSREGTCE